MPLSFIILKFSRVKSDLKKIYYWKILQQNGTQCKIWRFASKRGCQRQDISLWSRLVSIHIGTFQQVSHTDTSTVSQWSMSSFFSLLLYLSLYLTWNSCFLHHECLNTAIFHLPPPHTLPKYNSLPSLHLLGLSLSLEWASLMQISAPQRITVYSS